MIMAAEEIRETKNRIAYTVMIVRDFGEAHQLTPCQAQNYVSENRHASRTGFTHRYDIVIGPVANDSMALQFRLYEQGYITLKQLASKITFPKDNSQHFFATERAVRLLRKVEVINP